MMYKLKIENSLSRGFANDEHVQIAGRLLACAFHCLSRMVFFLFMNRRLCTIVASFLSRPIIDSAKSRPNNKSCVGDEHNSLNICLLEHLCKLVGERLELASLLHKNFGIVTSLRLLVKD